MMKAMSDLSTFHDPSSIVEPAPRDHSAGRLRFNDFYELTKPRLNFLVVVTTMVGFFMATGDHVQWWLMLNTILGTALTAAGAGALNMYVERNHDALMARTANRPLPAGRVSPLEALVYGAVLGLAGPIWLAFLVNPLTAILGAITLLSYVLIYTPMKRTTTLCTIVGAVPGAIPPMMGWTAVTSAITPEAMALFGILFLWQMPHFLAIAILYKDDYRAGGFVMLPCIDPGLEITSRQIIMYLLAMIPVSIFPVMIGMAGPVYFTLAVLLGLAFLSFGISCAATKSRTDSRKLFFASIIYLPLLLAALMIDKL